MRTLIIAALALGLWAAVAAAPTIDPSRSFSLGLGVGQMYGQVGTNIEYRATDILSLSGGIGLNGESNWFVGGRVYLKPASTAHTRSRITVGVATVDENGRHPSRLLLAVGGCWCNAKNEFSGWDIDLTTDGRISFGYHF